METLFKSHELLTLSIVERKECIGVTMYTYFMSSIAMAGYKSNNEMSGAIEM